MKKLYVLLFVLSSPIGLFAQQLTSLQVSKKQYSPLENPIPLNVWGAKFALPINFSATSMGTFDSVSFNLYGMQLENSSSTDKKVLALTPFTYPESQLFPVKTSMYSQQVVGEFGKRVLSYQFDFTFDDFAEKMSYQIILREEFNDITFHYGKSPLVGNVNKLLVGISGENEKEETLLLHLLQGAPNQPQSYYSYANPYNYVNNFPEDSTTYHFSGLVAGINKKEFKPDFWLENTQSGFRVPSKARIERGELISISGQVVCAGKLFGDYLFFENAAALQKGVYIVKIYLKNGQESSLKWSNQ